MAMVVSFGAIQALPVARWFYEIEPIPLADAAVLGFIALGWALGVFAVRRLAVVDRIAAAVQARGG